MTDALRRMLVPKRVTIALAVLLFVPFAPIDRAAAGRAAQASCFVSLTDGDVQGVDLGPTCGFLGIPYAASTAGDNRWRPPQPRAPWGQATISATTGVPVCAQAGAAPGTVVGIEDCLYLNIWTPNPPVAEPAPVIVWFHTGAFIAASANFAGTNGRRLAQETGAIVVAPNYRLGPFGFLTHTALADESSAHPTSGNYGLLDQQAALQWVRDNIDRFGGDPNAVTIAGTSAGGTSVGLHLISPASAGLFQRAILQSSYLLTTRLVSHDEFAATGDALANALGCIVPQQVLACMRSKTLNHVATALPQGVLQVMSPPNRAFWEPVVDGIVLPDQPRVLFEQGAFERVPTIMGVNRDEGWGNFITRSFMTGVSLEQYEAWIVSEFGPHASSMLNRYPADLDPTSDAPPPAEAMARVVSDVQFACEARRLARALERTGVATFLYSYEYEIDDLSLDHVIHGVESNVIFGNNYLPPVFANHPLDAADNSLHAKMAGYWTRFARRGDPNRGTESEVSWPPFHRPDGSGRGTDKYIIFDSVIGEGSRLREAHCDFLEPLFFRSILGGVPAAAQ